MAETNRPAGEIGRTGWDVLDEEHVGQDHVWLHVRPRTVYTFVLLRPEPFVYVGHFGPRGMRPCPGQATCTQCAMGLGRQKRAVFSMMDVRARRPGLLEVGEACAREVWAACQANGQGRGLVFRLSKPGGRDNSAIVAAFTSQILRESELPEGPDPEYVLKRQWAEPERLTPQELKALPGR